MHVGDPSVPDRPGSLAELAAVQVMVEREQSDDRGHTGARKADRLVPGMRACGGNERCGAFFDQVGENRGVPLGTPRSSAHPARPTALRRQRGMARPGLPSRPQPQMRTCVPRCRHWSSASSLADPPGGASDRFNEKWRAPLERFTRPFMMVNIRRRERHRGLQEESDTSPSVSRCCRPRSQLSLDRASCAVPSSSAWYSLLALRNTRAAALPTGWR